MILTLDGRDVTDAGGIASLRSGMSLVLYHQPIQFLFMQYGLARLVIFCLLSTVVISNIFILILCIALIIIVKIFNKKLI